ncbi:MAG: hypothetical protein DHS20C14_06580 [Phycisphaeraceae bacterium]|nr:MAG: hypothetical protein DHS20C14_06580 [Phycisphaeraceae bacterium]
MPDTLGYADGITISIQVADLNKALAWYGKVLGFETLYKVDEIAWGEVKTSTPGVNIGLGQAESPKTGAGAVPVFGVSDIAAARATLESHDVKFDGDTQEIPGLVKLATFFDPDGNAYMLSQTLAQS